MGVLLLALLLLVVTSGCTKKSIFIHMKPRADANNGRPVYVVVREASKKDFLTQYYDDVAALIHADNRDEEVLGWGIVLPGEMKELKVPWPEESDIAIYGLFTDPGSHWKVRVPQPLKKGYWFAIEGNNLVERIDKSEEETGDGA